jgi:predicted esterase
VTRIVALLLLAACAGGERSPSSLPGKRAPQAPAPAPTPAVTAPAIAAPEPDPPTCGNGTCGSGGAAGTQTSWPCESCITTVPASYDPSKPTPLVVSFHGDEGAPSTSHEIWQKEAEANGYILLSPACPRDLGCKGRWGSGDWHRDGPAGSVAWVNAQIDAVEAAYNIDRTRIYLVGGSRGAVYIGFHADAFAPRIAGVAMYAGGYSSVKNTCASCALPVYILVGDRDFLLDIATKARDWFVGCGSEVVFDKVPRLTHRGAGKSLLRGKAKTILDWFSTHPNACLAPPSGAPAPRHSRFAPHSARPRR